MLGHYLVRKATQDRFYNMLTECIAQTTKSGFTVAAVVCDQDATQWGCLRSAGVSPENPFLPVELDGHQKKVYVVVDIPHCLKNMRNALQNYNIEFGACNDRQVASWTDLQHLWYLESNKVQQLRLVPKLTEAHVNLTLGKKMRVCLAAQLLSRTTGCALKTYAAYGLIKSRTVGGTALFCYMVNKIFDLCNTAAPYDAIRVGNLGRKIQEMQAAMDWLDSLTFYRVNKVTGEVSESAYHGHHFASAWHISLSSFCGLSRNMVGTGILQQLLFRKFTQVICSLCFSKIYK